MFAQRQKITIVDEQSQLKIVRINASTEKKSKADIVFFHGWGFDCSIYDNIVNLLEEYDCWLFDFPGFGENRELAAIEISNLSRLLKNLLPNNAYFVGWSLGGMFATALAETINTVRGVISIACNPKFVADEQWKNAMALSTFGDFYQGFDGKPLSTFNRFLALTTQNGCEPKRMLRECKRNFLPPTEAQKDTWLHTLNWLAEIDNRNLLAQSDIPHLAILAKNDALVPIGFVEQTTIWPAFQYAIISECSHILPLEAEDEVSKLILQFIGNSGCQRSKHDVAASFAKAAHRYDNYAHVQQKIGSKLCRQLPDLRQDARYLDVGAGSGKLLAQWSQNVADENVVALDLAEGMLQFSKNRSVNSYQYVCADAEWMPFADGVFDGIYSNLAIQWLENIESLFEQFARVLKPGAWAVFTTLGPATLAELKHAWRHIDPYVHVNKFHTRKTIESAIVRSGLVLEAFTVAPEWIVHDSILESMRDLKGIGAHNINNGRAKGLMSRSKLHLLEEKLKEISQLGGKIKTTYDVYYIHLSKPDE